MSKGSSAMRNAADEDAASTRGAASNVAWAALTLAILIGAGAFASGYAAFRDALEERYGLSVFARITEENTFRRPDLKAAPPTALLLRDNSVKRLTLALDTQDFALSAVRRGARVPRLFVATLPEDIDKIDTVQGKRDTFIRTLLPIILAVNERIDAERRYLLELRRRVVAGEILAEADDAWLVGLAERYKVPLKAKTLDWDELILRVDQVPPSLAIAQSIVETGWGASPAARRLNALFGMIGGDGTDTAKLAQFETLYASVAAYVHNLNTYGAYGDFRRQRALLRAEGKAPDGHALAITLLRYSELGLDYTRHIQGVIRSERLKPFDDAKLVAEEEEPG